MTKPRPLTSATYDVDDFFAANELYQDNGWTDGLPIVPPTEALVGACLDASRLPAEAIVGVESVRRRRITAEKVAIAAVMAGCRPEYMPVVLAVVRAMQDAQAVAILATCRRAMADGARLLLVERSIAEDPRDALSVLHADLEMLVNVGGRERTTEEYAALFARSGLSLIRTILLGYTPAGMGHYILEAKPAS
jgi:O-methyltransferase domain